MAIFKITKNKVEQIGLNPDGFGSEFELRDLFAANLESLIGVRYLDKEYQTSDGRIDTIGLDENGAPVIIEYKWKENEEALVQGLSYLRWLRDNKKHFALLVEQKLGKDVEIAWENPRVIVVAQGFSKRTRDAVEFTQFVELKSYSFYGEDTLQLENVYTPKNQRRTTTQQIDNTQQEIVYDLEYHLKLTQSEISKKIQILREQILQLPEVEEVAEQKSGVTYRTTKSFTRFEFKANFVQILVRSGSYEVDTKQEVQDITSFGWGFCGKIKFTQESDIDYIFEIIKSSYESTL